MTLRRDGSHVGTVGGEAYETGSTTEPEPDRFRIYASSVLGTVVFFLLAVGVPTSIAFGLSWGAAVGGMCAMWVGPGFGVMIGGARLVAIDERRAAARLAGHAEPVRHASNESARLKG